MTDSTTLRTCANCGATLDNESFAKFCSTNCSYAYIKVRNEERSNGEKRCPSCEGVFPFENFYPSPNRVDGRRPYCKECQNKDAKEWRAKHPRSSAKETLEYRAKHGCAPWETENYKATKFTRFQERQIWYAGEKRRRGCLSCGEDHPACLEFHHRNPEEKVANVSRLLLQGKTIEVILLEMDKCDCLCANCHRKMHWK